MRLKLSGTECRMMNFKTHINDRCRNQPDRYGWVDYDEEVFTVPLWNLSGQLKGYQQYRWDSDKSKSKKNNPKEGRYFTYRKSEDLTVFGLDHLNDDRYLFVVEGIFEAIAAISLGFNCIAVLSNNPTYLKEWLICTGKEIVPLCQDDIAGRMLGKLNLSNKIILPNDLDECLNFKGE